MPKKVRDEREDARSMGPDVRSIRWHLPNACSHLALALLRAEPACARYLIPKYNGLRHDRFIRFYNTDRPHRGRHTRAESRSRSSERRRCGGG
jgi:hypothetical protein